MSSYLNLLQRKKDLRYQLYHLQLQYSRELTADTIRCRSYYHQFTDLLLHYYGELSLLDSSWQLLEIKTEENRQLQATSEDVLKVKLSIEMSKLGMVQLRNEVEAKALQISLLARRLFRYTLPE